MNKPALWTLIIALAVISLGQGYYIYSRNHPRKPAVPDPWARQDQWISEARQHLFRRDPVPFKQFDDLFDDVFFGHRFDPFREIARFQDRMRSRFADAEQPLFDRSWSDWFDNRINLADIRPEIKSTDKEVILTFNIPGLDAKSLNVNVNDDRIRISYDTRSLKTSKNEKNGTYLKSETVQHFEKVIPIPPGADSRRSRMTHAGNTLQLIFARRPDKSPRP